MPRYSKNRVRFTQKLLAEVTAPQSGRLEIYDTEIPALGLRVSPTAKTFFVVGVDPDGVRIRVTLGQYPRVSLDQARPEASSLLGEIVKGLRSGKKPEKTLDTILVQDLLDRYLSDAETRSAPLKPRTIKWNRYNVEFYLAEWRNWPLSKITPDVVDAKFREMLASGKSLPTAHGVFRTLRSLWNYGRGVFKTAAGERLLGENPVLVLSERRTWKTPEPRTRVLAPHEIGIFVKELNLRVRNPTGSGRLPHALLFLLFTGARKNEVLCLRRSDVSVAERTVLFRDTKNRENPNRRIPLPDYLVPLVTTLLATPGTPDSWLFATEHNKTGHVTEYRRVIQVLVANSGGVVQHFSAHDLRRTFITYGKKVAPGDYVELLVGHTLPSVTGKHYFNPTMDELRDPMNAIARRLLDLAKTPPPK